MNSRCFIRYSHPLDFGFFGYSKRTYIKGFFICVVKLQSTRPGYAISYSFDNNINSYVLCLLLAVDAHAFPHSKRSPKQVGIGDWKSENVPSVDRYTGPFLRSGFTPPF